MLRRILPLVLLALMPLFAESDEEQITTQVQRYAQGIVTLATTGSEKHFEGIVTPPLQTKLMLWIKAWQDDNLHMDAQIKKIAVNSLERNATAAKVVTKEAWSYQYINTKLKKIVLPRTDIHYLIEYSLQKNGDRWIIDNVETLFEEQSRPQ